MAELSLRDVRAGYGETVVLEDIAFELPERGALAVLGRNGVGKTTLLATIMGHTTFHAGSIEYQGKPIAGLPHWPLYESIVGVLLVTGVIYYVIAIRGTAHDIESDAATGETVIG